MIAMCSQVRLTSQQLHDKNGNEFPIINHVSFPTFTAAHCVKGFMWFMIKVTFGEHDRCDDSMRPETRFVLRAISQKFSYSNFDNDMALLRLNDRVPITDYIRYNICY